jgi:hypothetical protein
MPKIIHRAYNGWRRTHVAVQLDEKRLLQVFPFKQEFASLVAWRHMCTGASHFKTEGRRPVGTARREAEFGELLSMEYAWLIKGIQRISEDTVQITFNDSSCGTLTRNLNFAEPPVVRREGVLFLDGGKYKPQMSCAHWLSLYLFT